MRALWDDVQQAARQLCRVPALALLAILTLALGVGVNTAIFSVVNGLTRPLPVRSPGQIVVLAARLKNDRIGLEYRLSYPALGDLRQQASAFHDLFGFAVELGGMTAGDQTRQIMYSAVTGDFFAALGVAPAVGRVFLSGEGETRNSENVLVLGYSCWRKRFGGDPGIVGRRVRVDGRPVTVVGVAPKEFHGLYVGADMDAYLPLSFLAGQDNRNLSGLFTARDIRLITVVGRMGPGVDLAQAQASADVVARRMAAAHPATDRDVGIAVTPETLARPMPLRRMADITPALAGTFLGLAGLVVLVACTDVANLLLVRANVRRKEMAVRTALGAGRWRVVRAMVAESMMLSLLGGLLGTLFALWASSALSSIEWLETSLPVAMDFSFDWTVFAYAVIATVVTGALAGAWPGLRASQVDVRTVLHQGGRAGSGGGQRVRGMLVIGQVAASFALLVAAGLFVRQLGAASRIELGFEPSHLLNVTLDPHHIGYSQARTREFYRTLEQKVRALPGVEAASVAFSVPMGYWNSSAPVLAEGQPRVAGELLPTVLYNPVDSSYLETLRIPLVRGRGIRESDSSTAPPVAVINETMATRFWPDGDAIGKRFSMRPGGPLVEVVGVVRNGKYMVLFESPQPYFYVPIAQDDCSLRVLQVRTTVEPRSLIARVEREVRAIDPAISIIDARTMQQSLAGGMGFMIFRFGAWLAGCMGLLGLALAVVGVFGVVAYSASQRTREVGVRLALGATPRDVLRLLLSHGMRLALWGVAAGLALAIALARIAGGFLAFVSPFDPATFIGVTLLLSGAALAACLAPARRAMRVDPMTALRHE